MNSNISFARNPSNLIAPLKINNKLTSQKKSDTNIIKAESKIYLNTTTSTLQNSKFNSTKLNQGYNFEGDFKYEDEYYVKSLIPKRFYLK